MSAQVEVDAKSTTRVAGVVAEAKASAFKAMDAALSNPLEEIGKDAVEAIAKRTNVKTGALKKSTKYVIDWKFANHRSGTVSVIQPATNKAGQEYVRWVLPPGHGSYPGNPYPEAAMPEIRDSIKQHLPKAAREIGQAFTQSFKGLGRL